MYVHVVSFFLRCFSVVGSCFLFSFDLLAGLPSDCMLFSRTS